MREFGPRMKTPFSFISKTDQSTNPCLFLGIPVSVSPGWQAARSETVGGCRKVRVVLLMLQNGSCVRGSNSRVSPRPAPALRKPGREQGDQEAQEDQEDQEVQGSQVEHEDDGCRCSRCSPPTRSLSRALSLSLSLYREVCLCLLF